MLFVGNHTTNKGLDVLLKSLPMMRQQVCAVVAGAIRSRVEHEKLLAEAGVAESADRQIFTDFVTNEQLRALYHGRSFCVPTRADTLPLIVLEAMVSSLPVVSTRVGGIHEVTPETGILVEPGDPIALSRALDQLCDQPESRRAMGVAARARVLEIFNWEASAKCAVEIYREVLEARANRHSAEVK